MINFIKSTSAFLIALLLINTVAYAQEEEVSDADLEAYAALILKIDEMKAEAKTSFGEMVKSHELMDAGRRYNAIKKAKGDEAKLAEIKATPEELAAFEELVGKQKEASANIKSFLGTNVKEGIGAKMYNIIKKKIKSDEAFKARYDKAFASVKAVQIEQTLEETN